MSVFRTAKVRLGLLLSLGLGTSLGGTTMAHVFHKKSLESVSDTIDVSQYDRNKSHKIEGLEPQELILDNFDFDGDDKISKEEKDACEAWLRTWKGTFFANVAGSRNRIRETARDMVRKSE